MRARKSFWLAVIISLLLHLAVLFLDFSSSRPAATQGNSTVAARPRLIATLASPVTPLQVQPIPRSAETPASAIRKPAKSLPRPTAPKKLNVPTGVWANRSWSNAERADMDKFLNELDTQAKPPSGQELAQRALAMARQMGRSDHEDGVDETSKPPEGRGKIVEPYSLEMYFDAFLRKLNRSAAFVKNEQRTRGSHKALVEISLNADGSLKSYRVLRSGDQDAEIAYIKSVIERASPFSAFPPDIRKARDSLSIMMCIYPTQEGAGGGFSRSSGGQDCRD